jgi:uncharacterized membrane-anchored protein
MRKKLLGLVLICTISSSFATDSIDVDMEDMMVQIQHYYDSIEQTLNYQKGAIPLGSGMATLNVPEGFAYLNPEDASTVLTELWGNPKGDVLGMLVPEGKGVSGDDSWAFVIQYEELGYVEDDDTDDIDYNELLEQMKTDEVAENAEREKLGYDPIHTVGWASTPFYDDKNKVLHWAYELKFGDAEVNTLNYNIRVLGRKGVMVLNAVGNIDQLEEIKPFIETVRMSAVYEDGHKYEQFDSSVDNVAAYTVGGLVAGKVLAKVGLFAVIAKFGKLIFLGLLAAGGAAWKWLSGRKNKDNDAEQLPSTTV